MKKPKQNNFISAFCLTTILIVFSACGADNTEKTTEEEGDKMLEEMQQTEQQQADSVLEYWKNKTRDSI
jgi:hypothetical protein